MNEEELFKVSGYELDKEQKQVVLSKNKNILVIAGAGSGKSLTIIGKIKYLIYKENIKNDEILCISFTNDSCKSLKNNLQKNNIDVEVLTFHKLGMKILKLNNVNVNITEIDVLQHVVDLFFYETIFQNHNYIIYTLKYEKVKFNKSNYIELYKKINLSNLKKLIVKFIHLFKSNGFKPIYMEQIIKKNKNMLKKRYCYLLIIITKIMYEYQCELNNEELIDFDDIILLSTKYVQKTHNLNYKYIIIDEFQDTSLIRYNLIKELINNTKSNFLAVGDDYQSIYRFTGCDLCLFLNFSKYFEDAAIYKIQTTYRNSQELISVSGNFVSKNKLQIKKDLKSNKRLNKPIKIIYYKNQIKELNNLLEHLYINNKKKILILTRNNKDIDKVINKNLTKVEDGILLYKDIKIKYLTVHKSKGLEEEITIILSLENNDWSFPNKIKDEKILNYVLPKKENYKYAEERRLFYVALTRTKNETYLLASKNNQSIFVKELVKTNNKYVDIIKI